ncbi:uncharacterized protein LOC134854303 [Symsagittifera roscoffensis]|uniref:uncharacterized protein LOC134854303 n=1 Tax=Symsagittifera roscoffensis TaxID=84072 RepID=UPI00307C6E9C
MELNERHSIIHNDLQCILSQYELNSEIFVEPIEAFRCAILICHQIGAPISKLHKNPEYRLIQNDIVASESEDEVSDSISGLSSFVVTFYADTEKVSNASLKLYLDGNYGLSTKNEIDFAIIAPGLVKAELDAIRSSFKEIISENEAWSISEIASFLPDLKNLLDEFASKKSEQIIPQLLEKNKSRYWIVSHHIYSKVKRKDMLFWAKEYNLRGFCLPGKPGVICVEGEPDSTEAFWSRIRKWNWQRLQLVVSDSLQCDCDLPKQINCDCVLKFDDFEELVFENASHTKQDMTKFRLFLSEHGCENIFDQLFGLNSSVTSS